MVDTARYVHVPHVARLLLPELRIGSDNERFGEALQLGGNCSEPAADDIWRMGTAHDIQCQNVSSSWHTVSLKRNSLAGEGEFQDTFSFNVINTGGGVMMRSLSSDYVPVAPTAIDQNMAACGNLSQNTAETTVFGENFVYTILGGYCSYVSQDRYYPALGATDTVTFVGSPYWEWTDGSTSVSLRKKQRVNLEVNPSNVTQALLDSDAYCGPNVPVGWELVLDTVTGALLQAKAGLGCICFN